MCLSFDLLCLPKNAWIRFSLYSKCIKDFSIDFLAHCLGFSNINLSKSLSVCCRLSWNSNVLGKFARNCQEYVSNEHHSKFKRSTTNMIFMCDLIFTFIFLFILFWRAVHFVFDFTSIDDICIWFSSFYAILWGAIWVCVCANIKNDVVIIGGWWQPSEHIETKASLDLKGKKIIIHRTSSHST